MSRRSPLHDYTAGLGATFTEFGGWTMPMEFDSVIAEHMAVRQACGWFDVSHLGRFAVSGPRAAGLVDSQTTIRGSALEPGRTRYALVLDESGGIVDDIVVWRLASERFIVLPNAANAPTVMERFVGAETRDLVADTAMIAIQGPDAPAEIEAMTGAAPSRFRVSETERAWIQAGTGYHDFVGRDALDPEADSKRVRFTTGSRRVPRQGQALVDESGRVVGRVTSGSFSPVRQQGIGMGLLEARPDRLHVDIRGRRVPVEGPRSLRGGRSPAERRQRAWRVRPPRGPALRCARPRTPLRTP